MTTPARVAAAAVIGVLLIGGAFFYFGKPGQPAVGGPGPSPSPSTPASPIATPKPPSSSATSTTPACKAGSSSSAPARRPTARRPPESTTRTAVAQPRGRQRSSRTGPWCPGLGQGHLRYLARRQPCDLQRIRPPGTGLGDRHRRWRPGAAVDGLQRPTRECMDAAPAYSPDGKRIVFVRATETSSVLAIRDLASGGVTTLDATRSSSSDVWLDEPSWSPDSRQIVYHKVIHDAKQDESSTPASSSSTPTTAASTSWRCRTERRGATPTGRRMARESSSARARFVCSLARSRRSTAFGPMGPISSS